MPMLSFNLYRCTINPLLEHWYLLRLSAENCRWRHLGGHGSDTLNVTRRTITGELFASLVNYAELCFLFDQ